MQRIAKSGLLVGILVFVATLTGCATTTTSSGDLATAGAPKPVNVTDAQAINALCGDTAKQDLAYVKSAADAPASSGKRHALKDWGVTDPTNDAALTEIIGALQVRANTACSTTTTTAAKQDGTVGVQGQDGSVATLPLITSNGDATVLVDTTTNPATPPLLDGSLRFTAQTLSWAGLVQRVGTQQWYIDGINARAAQTGFNWNDVLKFASVNKMVDGKVAGVNALAIQVYNQPNLTDEQVRAQVRTYITPDVEATIGKKVEELPIQRIDGGFNNTLNRQNLSQGNPWKTATPTMGTFFDQEKMIRVSLMPIVFDANGNPVSLDGSRGAGVFIDCGNLHWVPVAVWTCTTSACSKPTPPPTPVCQWNPNLPPNSPNCLQPKDWSKSPHNGWTPLQAGPLTNGQQSAEQKASGQTSGNVTDNTVPAGTASGTTTSDLSKGTTTAQGATPGGDNQSAGTVDTTVTNQNTGGTTGDTCITDPDTGVRSCK